MAASQFVQDRFDFAREPLDTFEFLVVAAPSCRGGQFGRGPWLRSVDLCMECRGRASGRRHAECFSPVLPVGPS